MTFTIDSTSYRSPNYSSRGVGVRIGGIVLHTGEGTRQSDLDWLCKPQGEKSVSAHYYVCRDGTIYQLVDDKYQAWHAGLGSYLGYSAWGRFSLGIETEHKQGQDWPQIQMNAWAWLCKELIARYGIDQQMVIAHRWIVRPPGAGVKYDPTNFPDPILARWIGGLYVTDWAALWGPYFDYFEESGIAQRWRQEHTIKPLGECVTDEHTDALGRVLRGFRNGVVWWWQGTTGVWR